MKRISRGSSAHAATPRPPAEDVEPVGLAQTESASFLLSNHAEKNARLHESNCALHVEGVRLFGLSVQKYGEEVITTSKGTVGRGSILQTPQPSAKNIKSFNLEQNESASVLLDDGEGKNARLHESYCASHAEGVRLFGLSVQKYDEEVITTSKGTGGRGSAEDIKSFDLEKNESASLLLGSDEGKNARLHESYCASHAEGVRLFGLSVQKYDEEVITTSKGTGGKGSI